MSMTSPLPGKRPITGRRVRSPLKPQARIQAAIDILQILRERELPMDLLIGDYMRGRRYIGAKDRRYIAESVYDMVRHTARLGWILAQIDAEDTPRSRLIAWLALYQGADEKRLKDLFDGSKYAPPQLSAQEIDDIKLFKKPDPAKMPEAVRTECPQEYEPQLRALFGNDFAAEMEAMLHPAPLDLRVNTFLISRENAQKSLAKDGVETQQTPCSPWGLRCTDKAYLAKTKAFHKGWIEIQDEGSQMIAAVCDPQPGMQVLDFCAGGGGKTLAFAAAMNRKGRIVAMDTDERRLEKGRARYKKAGLADMIEVRPLSDDTNRKWLRRQKEKFDIVLCDVPCTGTGTWRRNPDMRWRSFGPPLEELLQLQQDILQRASKAVKPGGRLVYATCSLLPEENEEQVTRFLKENENFVILSESEGSQAAWPDPSVASLLQDDNTGFMRLTPHRHGTDGFFTAVLSRPD